MKKVCYSRTNYLFSYIAKILLFIVCPELFTFGHNVQPISSDFSICHSQWIRRKESFCFFITLWKFNLLQGSVLTLLAVEFLNIVQLVFDIKSCDEV